MLKMSCKDRDTIQKLILVLRVLDILDEEEALEHLLDVHFMRPWRAP